jgi:hypothetical protein
VSDFTDGKNKPVKPVDFVGHYSSSLYQVLSSPYQYEEKQMEYLLLIYTAEAREPKPGSDGFQEMMVGYGNASKFMNDREAMRGGNALKPVATATCVSVREGNTIITDGPFAETKEQLGGYYLVDCKDLDEALECAAHIPGAKSGRVEVRPIETFS